MLTNDPFIWPAEFSSITVFDDIALPSSYNLTVELFPASSQSSAVIGFKKIKQFVSKFLQHSIIIPESHHLTLSFLKLSNNVVLVPQDPYDYFLGSVLYRKLTAITKNYLEIQSLAIDSSIGDRIKYHISSLSDSYSDSLNQTNQWWNMDNLATNHFKEFPSWENFDITSQHKFHPKVIQGGKCESDKIR